jgi:hypothetical protein
MSGELMCKGYQQRSTSYIRKIQQPIPHPFSPIIALGLWCIWAYFITICTKDSIYFFGSIQQGIMHLSPLGVMAKQVWENTFTIRTVMTLTTGASWVSPNHFKT